MADEFADVYVTFSRDTNKPSGWKAWVWEEPYKTGMSPCFKLRIIVPPKVYEGETPDMVVTPREEVTSPGDDDAID